MLPPEASESDGHSGGRTKRGGRIPWFGLVLTLMFIGGVASVSVPCLLSAIQRSKQKQTMMTLRQLGGVIDDYIQEHDSAPQATSIEELLPMLEGSGVGSELPTDGWGTELRYHVTPGKPRDYLLWSAARDQTFDRLEALPPMNQFTRWFDCDIIWASGGFAQSPEGIPRS